MTPRSVASAWIVLCLAFAGCGEDEPYSAGQGAAPASGGAAGRAGAGGEGGGPPVDAGPVVRTVEVRNPFGDTELRDNLLVDGDFELTAGRGQYGWRAFSDAGEQELPRETGGLCRSGVVCGVLAPPPGGGSPPSLLAMGAAPADAPIEASLWAKPPVADCGLVHVAMISCTSVVVVPVASLSPDRFEPDESGWCHYSATAPSMDEQPCLVVDAPSLGEGQRVLVDQGYLRAAPEPERVELAAWVATGAFRRRVRSILKYIHEHRRIGRPPLPKMP